MGLKAVFLDFDDTLCATSEHDVPAFEAATAAAAAALSERGGLAAGPVDRARLLADFRAMFSRTPWDPSPDPVEVGAWRGALWARALALQVPPSEGEQAAAAVAAAGEAAQTAFDGHRLAHLVFAPGAREAVAHARARGLALVMITNGHHRVQRDKLAAVRAHELFPDPNSIIVGRGGGVARGRGEAVAKHLPQGVRRRGVRAARSRARRRLARDGRTGTARASPRMILRRMTSPNDVPLSRHCVCFLKGLFSSFARPEQTRR
jgi:FMN phosphatase YigB (HAD superfamily)